jgi:hypothetical protein
MSESLTIIIVEKNGNLKETEMKIFKEEELYKKCGFKKSEDFIKNHEWNVKIDKSKYIISIYGKTDGRANSENKYDFPPPVDNKLFFGNCALVGKIKGNDNKYNYINLSVKLWDKIYEKLFGGFEDLTTNAIEDEEEEDELKNIPKHKKTKNGYLKDGFVVDSDGDSDSDEECDENSEDYSTDENSELSETNNDNIILEDVGSELSEESYDYDSDNK